MFSLVYPRVGNIAMPVGVSRPCYIAGNHDRCHYSEKCIAALHNGTYELDSFVKRSRGQIITPLHSHLSETTAKHCDAV